MNRLFWKFFISILLAQITAAAGVAAVFWLREQNAERITSPAIDTGPRADDAIESAALTLQFGGVEALRQLLTTMRHHQIYAVDERDQEILHRPVTKAILQAARAQQHSDSARPAVRLVRIDEHHYLLFLPSPAAPPSAPLVFNSPVDKRPPDQHAPAPLHENSDRPEPLTRPPKEPFFQPSKLGKVTPLMLIVASLLASLLFAFLLAWYFSKRIMALRLAFELAAQGQLEPRFQARQDQGWIQDELSELGTDFDRMTQQLREMMERQTRLLHDVSHELRSPLARLQAAVGLAFQQPEKTPIYLERIERESMRMDKLVGELLTLARLEAGAFKAGFETFPIADLIADVIADAQFEASLKQCQIELSGSTQAEVYGRIELVARALENIVRNAIKHSPAQHHIRVEISTTLATSDEAAASSNNPSKLLCIRILDRGKGVPESELKQIFLPFYRGQDNATESQGHGLGLAIAQQVILAHHGSIQASARDGGGLCVEVRLPISGENVHPNAQH